MPPATFSVISGSRPDSVGGGGSSRNFPGSRERTRFSGGGGVVAKKIPVPRGGHQSNSLNSGTFFYISGQPQRNNINSLQKKPIYQKFGGPWPPWPLGGE